MSELTAVHRALGETTGPLTDELIDALVEQQVPESGELDFKRRFPEGKLAESDFPKDIAALANAGGGTIVYGVAEDQKRASGRVDVTCDENLERTLRQVAASKLAPGLLHLGITEIGTPGARCVVVEVPASPDAPHLIFNNDRFQAPLRVDADTHWMTERQIEAAYRARHTRDTDRDAALSSLYDRALATCDTARRAWFVAAAVPRSTAATAGRLSRERAQQCFHDATQPSLQLALRGAGVHPLEHGIATYPLRPGLRSWVAPRRSLGFDPQPTDAAATIGDGGAVTLTAVVGGHLHGGPTGPADHDVLLSSVECALADFLGILRATATQLRLRAYDLQFSVESTDHAHALQFLTPTQVGPFVGEPNRETVNFVPVSATLDVDTAEDTFHRDAYELARDCAHQAATLTPVAFCPPPGE